MNGEARRIAADLIDEEFNEFERFPREYAESAGWSPHNLKTGELEYTESELLVLAAMVEEFLDEGMMYSEILEQPGIRNYLSDLVASKAVKNLPSRVRRARAVRMAAANPDVKHTRGPWEILPKKEGRPYPIDPRTNRKFARIIAAYPDLARTAKLFNHLLRALKEIEETAEIAQGEWASVELAHRPDWVETCRDIANLAADAIAKAKD